MSAHQQYRNPEIESEQITILFARAPAVYIVNLVVTLVSVAALWDVIAGPALLFWAASMLVITVWRFNLLARFRRDAQMHIESAQRFAVVGSGISGALWGMVAFFLFPGDILHQAYLLVVVCGMLAGAVSSLSAYMPAFRAYFLPAAIALSLRLFMEMTPGGEVGRIMLFLALLLVLYCCALYFFARNGNATLLESLAIKFEKLQLAQSLLIKSEEASAHAESLRLTHRALLAISQCNKVMIRANVEQELLQEFCRILVEIGGYKLAWVGFAHHDPEKSIVPMAIEGADHGYVHKARISWGDGERGQGPAGIAVRTGSPVVLNDVQSEQRFKPWQQDAIERGYASVIALPLVVDERILGVLTIYAPETNAFDEIETDLLLQLSHDLAFGIQSLRTRAEIARQAWHDPLTGLPNRSLLHDRLLQAMISAKRLNRVLAVLFLDLDGFKEINDKYGHAVGDELIREVSSRFVVSVREGDTVSRLGGDEFVILLDLSSVQELKPGIERIMRDIVNPISLAGGIVVSISSSIGVTLYPQNDSDPDTLLRHADMAMYQAKQAGRNRYRIFDVNMDQTARLSFRMKERLAQALAAHEFVLYYQPKVNLQSGKVFGVEALIRWNHPERGLLPPIEFLPFAEESELMVKIGDWVLDAALRQSSLWREMGLQLVVSVNVSSRQLHEADFPLKLQQRLARYSTLAPESLELEILENTALQDIQFVKGILRQCKDMGVMLSLDDFGTGYSSLAYLKHLPVDILKIDQGFVRDMIDDQEDLAIIEGVISMAKIFGKDLIAEGVEGEVHGKMLLALGCDKAQGYGIARPMSADSIAAWVKDWESRPFFAKTHDSA